jgi:hypothetical protein
MHSLRHTHATQLLSQGVPIHTVKDRMGHADVITTLRIYGHAVPTDDSKALDAWGETKKATSKAAIKVATAKAAAKVAQNKVAEQKPAADKPAPASRSRFA